jgi:hypothetical protein
MSLSDGLRRFADRLAGRGSAERLVALFRNRAELKKELGALDEERHKLLDRLKLQEGATMRVEEQMDLLEQHLGRPDAGQRSLAYFQLKAVWRRASSRLQQFAQELERQQKDRERKQQLAAFERSQRDELVRVDRELVEARVLADQLQAEQKLAQRRLAELEGFWHYFRRRKLEDAIAGRAQRIESALTQVTDLSDRRHEIESAPPPMFEGLSLEGRRAVNLAVIAYAEHLYVRLAARSVASLARETTLRRVYDAGYGSPEECRAVMEAASKALAELEDPQEDLADIKARTDRMRRTAVYRDEKDTIPSVDSIAAQQPVNVLREEYWGVYKALLG